MEDRVEGWYGYLLIACSQKNVFAFNCCIELSKNVTQIGWQQDYCFRVGAFYSF